VRKIANIYFPHRTFPSIKNKLRKLKKKHGLYDHDHRDLKHEINERWIKEVFMQKGRPLKILDGYAGSGGSLIKYLPYSNIACACEINKSNFEMLVKNVLNFINGKIVNEGHIGSFKVVEVCGKGRHVICFKGDIERVASLLYAFKWNFDFIDLDPCGSCMFVIPIALKLLKAGYLAVTYGQLHLARLRRLDVLIKECPWIGNHVTMSETLKFLIKWTVYEGLRFQRACDTKILHVDEIIPLPRWPQGIVRVLFRVSTSDALADALNNFEREKAYIDKLVDAIRR